MERKVKILVVDDEESILDLMKRYLQTDFDTEIESSSVRALEKVEKGHYDVVITDIKMAEMDGITLIKKIKDINPQIINIVITAHGEKDCAVSSLRNGAFDFIEKPFTKIEILNSVGRAVEKILMTEQLRVLMDQSAKTKQLNSLNIVTSAIIHEITNPLMHILLHVDYLKKEIPKDIILKNHNIADYLVRIKDSVNHITNIIKNLRDAVVGKKETDYKEVAVSKIISEVRKLVDFHLNKYEIPMTIINPKDEIKMDCVPSLMVQVVYNLISNSIKAINTKEEKWVRIEISQKVGNEDNHEGKEMVQFKVIDSGNGVSEEIQEKIFDPLYSTHSLGGNLGLGLSISLEIVRTHRGKIYLDNSNKNTCFVLEIPMKRNG